jgi:arsenate reductase
MTGHAVGAELAGTGLLAYVVVGSGLTLGRLGADPAAGLFFHGIVVGLAVTVLIAVFAGASGAHFNPAVTLAVWRRGRIHGGVALRYVAAQIVGSVLGVLLANLTFGATALSLGATPRDGWGPLVAELVGTLFLVSLILILGGQGSSSWIGPGVGAWVAAMVFSTSSTGLLNPALTIARTLTDSYAGISPTSVPGLVTAQLLGGLAAVAGSSRLASASDLKGA